MCQERSAEDVSYSCKDCVFEETLQEEMNLLHDVFKQNGFPEVYIRKHLNIDGREQEEKKVHLSKEVSRGFVGIWIFLWFSLRNRRFDHAYPN